MDMLGIKYVTDGDTLGCFKQLALYAFHEQMRKLANAITHLPKALRDCLHLTDSQKKKRAKAALLKSSPEPDKYGVSVCVRGVVSPGGNDRDW